MKYCFVFFTCLFYLSVQSQERKNIQKIKSQISLSENKIYILCRGTKSKSGLIAQKFNIADKNITHIGIAYKQNQRLVIFNVVDERNHINALVIDSLESFITQDTYYLSIWEAGNSPEDFNRMRKLLNHFRTKKIYFDASFNIRNDDTLYCSEFTAAILNAAFPPANRYPPTLKNLDDRFYQLFLRRKKLEYYPVDFFQASGLFRKIFEVRF
ncbi:MAG: hypothetical protein H0U44_05715 [Flavisolibacter sp.]|jgi:hypothetical protein|nr:hypothetical protein [Flavisolibacter sp.]